MGTKVEPTEQREKNLKVGCDRKKKGRRDELAVKERRREGREGGAE